MLIAGTERGLPNVEKASSTLGRTPCQKRKGAPKTCQQSSSACHVGGRERNEGGSAETHERETVRLLGTLSIRNLKNQKNPNSESARIRISLSSLRDKELASENFNILQNSPSLDESARRANKIRIRKNINNYWVISAVIGREIEKIKSIILCVRASLLFKNKERAGGRVTRPRTQHK